MNLRRLLLVHSFITFLAGVILIVAPGKIPSVIGIRLDEPQFFICYLLGCAELSIAYLSLRAIHIRDRYALRLVCSSFIVFHLLTAMVEVWAITRHDAPSSVWINVAVRVLVSALFYYYAPRGSNSTPA